MGDVQWATPTEVSEFWRVELVVVVESRRLHAVSILPSLRQLLNTEPR